MVQEIPGCFFDERAHTLEFYAKIMIHVPDTIVFITMSFSKYVWHQNDAHHLSFAL